MGVLERANLLDPPQRLLQRLDVRKDFAPLLLVLRFVLLHAQDLELLVDLLRLGETIEEAS